MWLDLAIAMSCSGGGVVCGWIMHAIGGFGNHALVKQAAASIAQTEGTDEPTRERVSEVADRLKQYAMSMAANVDEHQTKVQAVNNKLIENGEQSPEAVFNAISQLIEANQQMQSKLQQAQDRIHEQAVQIESAEKRAETDALTRVPNRGAFDRHLETRHVLGGGAAGTLALLDVDHFKKFNDVYGHRAGDEVLKVVANMLHSQLQSYGLVARYGGEEFAIILDGCGIEQARGLVDAARAAIGEREIQFEDKCLRVTASVGIAELAAGESIEDWLQRADDGLYRSKEAGRNCGHWMDNQVPVLISAAAEEEGPSHPPTVDRGSTMSQPEPQVDGGRHAIAVDEGESGGEESGSTDESAKVNADPSAFAYLPDLETLQEGFLEIRGRTQSNVSIFVMAIHCSAEASGASMRSLLQIVRATMRTVDKIGCGDDATLLICMPSMDDATALERGEQIYRSAEAIGLGISDSGRPSVGIGVAEAGSNDEFADVVSRAMGTAQRTPEDGSLPVFLDSLRV